MSRDRVMKASDVSAKSQPAFGRKVSFQEAFPTIKEVTVNVEESNIYGRSGSYGYTSKDIGEYIDCSNSRCYNGGFSIGSILRTMVSKKEIDFETETIFCKGYEGSSKGRRRYRSCDHRFKAKVHIDYKKTTQ